MRVLIVIIEALSVHDLHGSINNVVMYYDVHVMLDKQSNTPKTFSSDKHKTLM